MALTPSGSQIDNPSSGGSVASQFNKSISVDTVVMSDDYWISVDDGAYDQALPLMVT